MFQIKDYMNPSFPTEDDVMNPFAKKKTEKRTPAPDIKIQVSGCDFLVTRKTARTEKTLAVLISQKLFFIRDEKTKEDEPLTVETLKAFMGKTEYIELIDDETDERCSWLQAIRNDKAFAERLLMLLNDPTVIDLGSKGYIYFSDADFTSGRSTRYTWLGREIVSNALPFYKSIIKRTDEESAGKLAAALGKFYGQDYFYPQPGDKYLYIVDLLFNSNDILLQYFEDMNGWGISGTTDFFLAYIASPLEGLCRDRSLTTLLTRYSDTNWRVFNRTQLQEYLFQSSFEQGCSDIEAFTSTYADYLRMKEQLARVSAKEYPLYPENLFSDEVRLSAVHRAYTKELTKIDDEDWEEYVKFLTKYEYTDESSGLMIVSPKTKTDMLDEATQQHNCLSSYINRVKDGECMIFFLRKTAYPNRSYVTVEVRSDGSLGQVLAACNKPAPLDAFNFVQRWHAKMFNENVVTAA